MNNIPCIKVGIVAVSRDCFPESLSVNRRKALVAAYTKKYGANDIYECPICIVESETQAIQAVEDLKKAVQRLESQVEAATGSRLERLRLEKQLGETKKRLLKQEENIFFDGMKIDQASEGEIEAFLAKEQMTAKWTRHFVVEVEGTK